MNIHQSIRGWSLGIPAEHPSPRQIPTEIFATGIMRFASPGNAPASEPSTTGCVKSLADYAVSVTLFSPGEVSMGR